MSGDRNPGRGSAGESGTFPPAPAEAPSAPVTPSGGVLPAGAADDGPTALRKIPLTLTVRKEYEFFSDFIAEFGEHIYPEGMFIPSPRPKPKGALVKIDFRTHDGFQILLATCEVVRADEALPGTLSGMWVSYRILNDTHRSLIQKIYAERESKRK